MHAIRGRSPLTRTPNKGAALLAAVVLLTALGGLAAGGEWRWLAVPACLFLGVTIFWSLSGWRQSEVQRDVTSRHLLDLVDFPTQSPYLCTPDGRALYTGAGFEEWTGLDGEAVAKGRWVQAIHDDEREAVKQAWAEALKCRTAYDREFRVLFRDGAYRWVRSRAYPSRDEEGRITRWVGILEDIHDRRSAEEQLRQTASLLEMIGSSAHSIIYAKDRAGRMLYGNRALETLTGRSVADLLGKTDAEWNPDIGEAQALQAADRMVLATGKTQDLEEVFTGRDGVARHYQSIKSPLRNAAGKVIGVVGVSSDVSAAREAEQREKLLCRELDHRAKNMLAVVQSVVTLTRADTLHDFKKAVEGRIQSLGRAHSMLAASRWEGADLHRLLEEELAPYRSKERAQLVLSGPTLLLRAVSEA